VPHPQKIFEVFFCEIMHFCALSHRNIKIGELWEANIYFFGGRERGRLKPAQANACMLRPCYVCV